MKKVLFIAYLYPPIANSGTRRSLEFANRLPDNGWRPIVLTASPKPADCEMSLLEEVREGTRIERTSLWTEQFSDRIGGFIGSQRVADGLKWRMQRLMQVPDECATWRPTAVRKGLDIFKREAYDAIYASGWPWTSFLVAAELSGKTGIPFVVDYRDLWKSSDAEWDRHTAMQRWFQPRLEKRVLRDASAVIATTSSFAQILEQQGAEGKAYCITNGFDSDIFSRFDSVRNKRPEDVFQISYTGVWRPGYGPDDLYHAIRQLKDSSTEFVRNLKVVTAGFNPGRAKEFGIDDIVEECGQVPHRQALEIIMHSDALYLPVSNGFYERASIPGKLFDYIGSGRPIIASAVHGSEVESVLASVGGACTIEPGDIDSLANAIYTLCKTQDHRIFSPRMECEANRYDRGYQCIELAKILEMVNAKSKFNG